MVVCWKILESRHCVKMKTRPNLSHQKIVTGAATCIGSTLRDTNGMRRFVPLCGSHLGMFKKTDMFGKVLEPIHT